MIRCSAFINLAILVYLLLTRSVVASSDMDIDDFEQLLCAPSSLMEQSLNLIEFHAIDLNADGQAEIAALHQGNNFANFHFYTHTDCGYFPISHFRGNSFTVLDYASSPSCFPVGCLSLASCIDTERGRIFRVASARHTLSQADQLLWIDGALPGAKIQGLINITDYKLHGETLVVLRSETVLFTAGRQRALFGKSTGVTFALNTCR